MQLNNIGVLVVDDEILIRDLLYDYFSSHGFAVHLAENGRVAVDMLDEIEFQVAILDLKMPEMDGLEVMAVLGQKKPFVPVIIMTAFPSLDSALESVKRGVFEYLIKPFKIANLHDVVRKAATEYQSRASTHNVKREQILEKVGSNDQVSKCDYSVKKNKGQ